MELRHHVLEYLCRGPSCCVGSQRRSYGELLRRFATSRDDAAFELLVWRHGKMVLRVCRGILRDAAAAEDAFQATFLALACKAAAVARYPVPANWLYRGLPSHVALKSRRTNLRQAAREFVRGPRPDTPAAVVAAETAELAAILHEEVNRLSTRYRTPIVLCYLEGKTHDEAARALGWPKGTVAGRLARARDLLKSRLTRRGVAFPATGLAVMAGATANAAVSAPLAASTAGAAAAFLAGGASAAAASAAATQLARGVIQTMFLAKVKSSCFSCLSGCGAYYRCKQRFSRRQWVGRSAGAVGDDRIQPVSRATAAARSRRAEPGDVQDQIPTGPTPGREG